MATIVNFCIYCKRSFEKRKGLNAHNGAKHKKIFDDGGPSCKTCGTVFASRSFLEMHMENEHPKNTGKPQCLICATVAEGPGVVCKTCNHFVT
uniref:C2H2-type domain-containing protein n=1 Tax=Fagus sylvatica TaxID=28930 RepID=A0A2N9FGE7_FAGSY